MQDLIERLRLQVGRLDITPQELEGRNQRSALFKTMFLAFKAAGPHLLRARLLSAPRVLLTRHNSRQKRATVENSTIGLVVATMTTLMRITLERQ